MANSYDLTFISDVNVEATGMANVLVYNLTFISGVIVRPLA